MEYQDRQHNAMAAFYNHQGTPMSRKRNAMRLSISDPSRYSRAANAAQAAQRTPEYRSNEWQGFKDSAMDNMMGTARLIDQYILRRPGAAEDYAAWDEYRNDMAKQKPGYRAGDIVGGIGAAFDPIADVAGGLAGRVAPLVRGAVREGRGLQDIIGAGRNAMANEVGSIGDKYTRAAKITKTSNAKSLKPRLLSSVEDTPSQPFLGGEYTAKIGESGAAVFDGDKVIASYNFGDTLVVDSKYRRKGIGEELVYQFRKKNPAAKPAETRTRIAQHIQEKVSERLLRDKIDNLPD